MVVLGVIKCLTFNTNLYKYMNSDFKVYFIWFLVFISASGDLITTYIGIEWYGLIESNQIADSVLQTTGFSGLVILKFAIILICAILSDKLTYGRWYYISPLLLIVIWTLITVYNSYLITIS